jgi:hypothetical protein
MNPISLMILTVLANAIVTGIIVYRIQKRFEANLQNSLFEHQTKFSRNYAKRVEVLETLYQKFMVFRDAYKKSDFKLFTFFSGTLELEADDFFEDDNDQRSKLADFWHYFEANRLYLPNRLRVTIKNIHDTTQTLPSLAALLFIAVAKNEPIPALLRDGLEQMLYMDAGSLGPQPPKFLQALMSHILELQRQSLEYLYQTVADTVDKETT